MLPLATVQSAADTHTRAGSHVLLLGADTVYPTASTQGMAAGQHAAQSTRAYFR